MQKPDKIFFGNVIPLLKREVAASSHPKHTACFSYLCYYLGYIKFEFDSCNYWRQYFDKSKIYSFFAK